MNICTPGNCICDAREWEGDTDCFGNTEEDDIRMAEGNRLGIDLLREWDAHNRRHRCYYDSAEYDGMAECPSYYATLGDFLGSAGFDTKGLIGSFFGRELSEPNFRSRISGTEIPVADSTEGVSISDRRKTHTLRSSRAASAYYEPTTDAVLSKRAERAKEGSVENEQSPWEVQAMQYFNDRLDDIQKSNEAVYKVLSDISNNQCKLGEAISELMNRVGEQSEPVTYNVVFDMKGTADEIAQAVEKALTRANRRDHRLGPL